MPPTNSKLEALRKILIREREAGFLDTTVIGGLDRFMVRWADQLVPHASTLGSYAVLTPEERREWAGAVLTRLGNAVEKEPSPTRRRTPRPRAAATVPPASLSLDDPVTHLRRIAKQTVTKLGRLGVSTVRDLIYLFPHRHNDFANVRTVSQLEPGREQTVLVTVWEASETGRGPRRRSTQAVVGDETGNVRVVWFNQPWLVRTLRQGTEVVLSGKVNVFRGRLVFESPEYELVQGQEELVHTGRLVPVYPTTEGLAQRTLRRTVKQALDLGLSGVEEFFPEGMGRRLGLMDLQSAVARAHYPETDVDWMAARRRLAFDELFMLQLAVLDRKRRWQQESPAIPLAADSAPLDGFLASLPFALTRSQRTALDDILADLEGDLPMSRLLQGDVGSGKTVVAAAALLVAVFSGFQGALMVPTEILAEQHFLTLSRLLSGAESGLGGNLLSVHVDGFPREVSVGLLLGSLSKRAKDEMHRRLAEGEVDLVIGTNAIIQEPVEIPRLALVVADEQHRFGVMQRASLREKGGRPHLLAMSATPIPRSLALTLYGDLDISIIDEMPPGRRQIRTRWVEPNRRDAAYGFLRKQVEEGRQAFVICPLVDESEVIQSRAATEEHHRLSTQVFPDLRLGLLHGRMALREKEQVMESFQRHDLDILVSTPVVEVGIDVANATVMLIDSADRFGLSQLHQFRGRVGRGPHQSYCLLLADAAGEEARERLKIVERVHDGFELAEEDLRLRGPGDYLGTRQSGLPNMSVARITDQDILTLARREAIRLLEADPEFSRAENGLLGAAFKRYEAGLSGEMS